MEEPEEVATSTIFFESLQVCVHQSYVLVLILVLAIIHFLIIL